MAAYKTAIKANPATVSDLLQQHGGVQQGGPQDEGSLTKNRVFDAATPTPSSRVVELIYAASEGDLVAVQRLVARGIRLDGADYDLRTPLHLAAAEGQYQMVKYFIDQEISLSPCDRWGNTPLDEARRHGHDRIVELLSCAT